MAWCHGELKCSGTPPTAQVSRDRERPNKTRECADLPRIVFTAGSGSDVKLQGSYESMSAGVSEVQTMMRSESFRFEFFSFDTFQSLSVLAGYFRASLTSCGG
jgi:hypothetical protein